MRQSSSSASAGFQPDQIVWFPPANPASDHRPFPVGQPLSQVSPQAECGQPHQHVCAGLPEFQTPWFARHRQPEWLSIRQILYDSLAVHAGLRHYPSLANHHAPANRHAKTQSPPRCAAWLRTGRHPRPAQQPSAPRQIPKPRACACRHSAPHRPSPHATVPPVREPLPATL